MTTSHQSTSVSARRIQFAFTDEQEQFRSAVRRFLNDKSPTTEVRRLMATAEGYDPAVWRQLSEDLALPGIHIPEQYGGAGFGMVELCIVTEELGRALLCAPYFSSAVLAANAILSAGTDAQKSALLPEIAKGHAWRRWRSPSPMVIGIQPVSRLSPLPIRTATVSTESKVSSWTATWRIC